MLLDANIHKKERAFLPPDYVVTDWENLKPYFTDLLERDIKSLVDLEKWLQDLSELESVVSEDACWRQIKMTCNTEDKSLEEAFVYFVTQIQPQIQPLSDLLNKKLVASPFVSELDPSLYFTYLRTVKKNIEIYRDENVPIQSQLSVQQQQFGVISSKMTIEQDGQEYTLQQAAKFLESPSRSIREEVYYKIQERRQVDKEELHALLGSLIEKRDKIAKNAGFENYRDYKFEELGRFDYTKEDCFAFHTAVREHVVPLVAKIQQKKKEILGFDVLRPWDLDAEKEGMQPLKPFTTGQELYEKTVACFQKLHPFFAECLVKMNELGRFDLDSRKGKSPGGYNCPLPETGVPFIFMNAAGQMGDVTTMVHEGGHAIHSFLAHRLKLTQFKEYPMEIAEVASMSMELFSMDHWDTFFDSPADLKRAKLHQLERVITLFPWIAIIDEFQHWLYENPAHTIEQRTEKWVSILESYDSKIVDFSGLEKYRQTSWQKQLHLFEVPFYYIEYGIAQLGAIGMWKQFKEHPSSALGKYMFALSLGGTKTLPELYEAAGIRFDLSPTYINELMQFVNKELNEL